MNAPAHNFLQSEAGALRKRRREPRGLSRLESADYIGVSATKFDEMVEDGRMPGPKIIDARRVWDVRKLDIAFEALPDRATKNTWDD